MTMDTLEKGLVPAVPIARNQLEALLCNRINQREQVEGTWAQRAVLRVTESPLFLYLDLIWGHLGEFGVWRKLVFGSRMALF